MCPTRMVAPATTRLLCALPGGREHPDRIRLAIRTYTPLTHYHQHQGRDVTTNGSIGPKPALTTITGELDSTAARAVADRCRDYIASTHSVIIDLSAVTFIDSAGIRLLQQLRELARARRGRVWLVDPSPIVQRVLDVVGVDADTISDVSFQQGARTRSGLTTTPLVSDRAPTLTPMTVEQ